MGLQSYGPYLSRRQAAELLGVKAETLKQWAWRNTGPQYRKVNGKVLYERSQVRAFIEASPSYGRDCALSDHTRFIALSDEIMGKVESFWRSAGEFSTLPDLVSYLIEEGLKSAPLRDGIAKTPRGRAAKKRLAK